MAVALSVAEAAVANPVIKGFFADPELLWSERDGRCYLYPTTDGCPPNWSSDKAFASGCLIPLGADLCKCAHLRKFSLRKFSQAPN